MERHRMRNPRGQGSRLRDELVDAASTLLESLPGGEAPSMRAVARQAGVAPQSVYLHFADRREVLTAVYEARFGELSARLTAAAAAAGDAGPAARLAAICRAYCDYGLAHPGHYRVLFGTAGTPGWEPQYQLGRPSFDMLRAAVAACLRPDAGDQAVITTAVCIWAALHGLVTLRRDRPSFPWPGLDDTISTLLDAHLGTTRLPAPGP